MSRKIEDAYNECFERLLSGESLDSCLSSYPEYAAELDSMLRTTFDIKRKAYPIQPRPEFKYWARVRMQGIQQADIQTEDSEKVSSFNIRRNLAISMAALLVFVMASTGTAAASSNALPDQPLYDVKLALEQVQLSFTTSETMKAQLYANLAEKRAEEISVMASLGKTDKVLTTTARMYDQMDKAAQILANLDEASKESPNTTFRVPSTISIPATTTPTATTTPAATTAQVDTTLPPVPTPPSFPTTPTIIVTPTFTIISDNTATSDVIITPELTTPPALPAVTTASDNASAVAGQGQQADSQPDSNSGQQSKHSVTATRNAKISVNASAAKTLTILQDALEKAPASVKPSLNAIIKRTKTSNARLNEITSDTDTDDNTVKSTSDNTSTGKERRRPNKPVVMTPATTGQSDNNSKPNGTNQLNTRPNKIINKDDTHSDNITNKVDTNSDNVTNKDGSRSENITSKDDISSDNISS
ncbi:MAG: hypothetical protein EHM12_01550, partial [Dehalococcoidia bacterium]